MPGYDAPDVVSDNDAIEAVADRVLSSFLDTASPDDLRQLASRPSIPQDLDRAMLMDASDAPSPSATSPNRSATGSVRCSGSGTTPGGRDS